MTHHEPNEACLYDPAPPAIEPPIVLPPDLRPWWRKLTNIGILIVAVAGILAPALAELGYTRAAILVGAIAGIGIAAGLKGAARRADAIRNALADTERSDP